MPSTFAELKNQADDSSQIWRALQGVGFLAPMSESVPEKITASGNTLITLEEPWKPIGIVGTDGYVFSEDVEKTEIEGWGYSVPVRSDITKAPKQVQVTPLQVLPRHMQELILGTDLSTVAADENGEVTWDEAALPEGNEYRLLVIGFDGTAALPKYRGKGFSKVKLAEKGDESWSADEDSVGQELTLDVLQGPEGFPVRHYLGGAGFDAASYGYGAPAGA